MDGLGLALAEEPAAVTRVSELAELAAALARIEVLVRDSAESNPDAAAAIERIADIAFVLHEREVEPSLCDALDAAMREISAANAHSRASAQRAEEAAQLLRGLARRVDAMIAAQAAAQVSAAPSGHTHEKEFGTAGEFPAAAGRFDAAAAENGAFAQAVAALAQSLPEHGEPAPAHIEPEQAHPPASACIEAEHPGSSAAEASASSAMNAPSIDSVVAPVADEPDLIDPDEDPGDLFEPLGIRPAADAPAPLPAMNAAAEQTAAAVCVAPQSAHVAAGAPGRAASAAAANDPLAAIRALSEEELIALFS